MNSYEEPSGLQKFGMVCAAPAAFFLMVCVTVFAHAIFDLLSSYPREMEKILAMTIGELLNTLLWMYIVMGVIFLPCWLIRALWMRIRGY